MAGIDYEIASIDVREKFSFTKTALEDIYIELKKDKNIYGSVIISTCNRTEIYISCDDDFNVNPLKILCDYGGLDFALCENICTVRSGNQVMKHLCQVSCGAKSQIFGEDQIITQVKNAVTTARDFQATNSFLEVLFRLSVTAGKKVKSDIKLSNLESSIVYKSLEIIKKDSTIKNIIVIGNGEIGKLTAKTLQENGYNVSMTLRQYKASSPLIPSGVSSVKFSDRYSEIEKSDAVVSATLSPHYTICKNEFLSLANRPLLLIDLALPRDIDPAIASLENTMLFDVDSISANETKQNHNEQLAQVNKIIVKYIDDFNHWCSFKKGLK